MRPVSQIGVGDAVERVYDAGHELVLRRLDLLAAEARLLARSGVAYLLAGIVALIGWLYLVAGIVEALSRSYPRANVEIAAGALHALVAFGLFALAARMTRKWAQR
ncbi:MAG TPA: hypothetical protein VFT98_15890 [Myxococcota bacterium]|nr:hypothetical protein [Myxococcota bacterium]